MNISVNEIIMNEIPGIPEWILEHEDFKTFLKDEEIYTDDIEDFLAWDIEDGELSVMYTRGDNSIGENNVDTKWRDTPKKLQYLLYPDTHPNDPIRYYICDFFTRRREWDKIKREVSYVEKYSNPIHETFTLPFPNEKKDFIGQTALKEIMHLPSKGNTEIERWEVIVNNEGPFMKLEFSELNAEFLKDISYILVKENEDETTEQ